MEEPVLEKQNYKIEIFPKIRFSISKWPIEQNLIWKKVNV